MSSVPSTTVPPLPSEPLSLDERIRRAELRLIAREDNLKRRIDVLGRRLHEVTRPARWIAPAIGGVVAVAALWLLLRGRAKPLVARAAGAARVARRSGGAEMPWLPMLAFAWPLLPAAWRTRSSPGGVATLVSLGLPLAQRLLRARWRPLSTAVHVNLARFAGDWFEVACLPQGPEVPRVLRVHYALHEDHLEVTEVCIAPDGGERVSHGVVRVLPDSSNAKLQVSMLPGWLHGLPFAWLDQWVLHVDVDYQVALIGHPDRRHLRVLSRSPALRPDQLAALTQRAAELEFPVERLQVLQPR